jgi:hypothetical protein
MHRSVLGEDKKCDERQEHTNHGKGGKEAGINMDLSEGPNKSKYKNEKKTTARVRQRKDKGEKLSLDSSYFLSLLLGSRSTINKY